MFDSGMTPVNAAVDSKHLVGKPLQVPAILSFQVHSLVTIAMS